MKSKIVFNNNIMLISLFIFIVLISVLIYSQVANARETVTYEKTFITIEIEEGQTLLSIAGTYAKPGQNPDEYIAEVKSMNNLKNSVIHTGCYLIVPTYIECN